MFKNIYCDKKILITGHTGFKGTWLTTWLLKLGANVCGVSDKIPTSPSMFEELGLERRIEHNICDIRNHTELKKIIDNYKPDFVFHLAAQPIVSESYKNPLETISTNVLGTANLLECLKNLDQVCHAVIVTSDKCYENVEWVWGYKETDPMGGKDIYSASKGSAELVFNAFYESYFKDSSVPVKIATGRAGNVIGGGDWAKDRIVVDCMRKWSNGDTVQIRNPYATRPWQHVLEPLSGYLMLGVELTSNDGINGESFNFGPRSEQNRTVIELLTDLSRSWGFASTDEAYSIDEMPEFKEAGLLKLNCDKANYFLKWSPTLEYFECVDFVSDWYRSYYNGNKSIYDTTIDQINKYETIAKKIGIEWTRIKK